MPNLQTQKCIDYLRGLIPEQNCFFLSSPLPSSLPYFFISFLFMIGFYVAHSGWPRTQYVAEDHLGFLISLPPNLTSTGIRGTNHHTQPVPLTVGIYGIRVCVCVYSVVVCRNLPANFNSGYTSSVPIWR